MYRYSLPKKEANLFKDLVEFHDGKQYKKGLKTADQILAKFPNNGQTQAMKGLILSCMDKKEEAHELAKLGVKNDIKSHITWHVLGILHRTDRNYKEAIKCFKMAVRISPDNQQLMRDLSWMQVQCLDFEAFRETRRTILVSKPALRINWVTFAVAHYLTGDYKECLSVLDNFFNAVTEERTKFENSEILLFQNKCIAKTGDIDKALEHLHSKEAEICDKNALRVRAAEYLTYQKRFLESLDMWLDLLKDQPENYRIHAGAQVAALSMDKEEAEEMFSLKRLELPSTVKNLSNADKSVLANLYGIGAPEGTISSIKSTRASRKIALSLQPSEVAFKDALDSFMQKMLAEGVPSLCHDICALIMKLDPSRPDRNIYVKDPVDFRANVVCNIAIELVNGYITKLKDNGTFTSGPVAESAGGPPTSLLWALFLRCHLLEMSGRYVEALADAEACVEHTPTALDMHVKKARLLKRLGDLNTAALVVDECRSLDLQDRYLNNKATKYFLRANKVSNAMDTIAMFTKDEGTTDPDYALFELQCVWYELESGEAHERLGAIGPALKKFCAVEKHFLDFIEDKFDFNSYCMRKGTLAAYLDLTQMLQRVMCHKYVQRATRGALRLYLNLLISKAAKDSAAAASAALAAQQPEMSAADKKKAKLLAQKMKKKGGAVEAATPAVITDAETAIAKKNGNANAPPPPKDEDPLGQKILEKDPATEALRWCGYVIKNTKSDPETQECACAVYMQLGYVELALKSISLGLAVAPNHPGLLLWLVKIARVLEGIGAEGIPGPRDDAAAEAEARAELCRLMDGLSSYEFVRRHCESAASRAGLLERLASARMSLITAGAAGAATVAELFNGTSCLEGSSVNAKNVQIVHEFLENDFKNTALAESFKGESLKLFPYMNYFGCEAEFKGIVEEQETTY